MYSNISQILMLYKTWGYYNKFDSLGVCYWCAKVQQCGYMEHGSKDIALVRDKPPRGAGIFETSHDVNEYSYIDLMPCHLFVPHVFTVQIYSNRTNDFDFWKNVQNGPEVGDLLVSIFLDSPSQYDNTFFHKVSFVINDSRSVYYKHGLISIPAWINDYTHHNMWDKITYPFPNFNGATVEVWEWIRNFISHFTGRMTT